MQLTKKGPDWSGMGWGVALVALGVGGALVLQVFDLTLRFKRIELPSWVPLLVCGIVVIVGAFIVRMFASSNKCVTCDALLELDSAYFPRELESEVVQAAKHIDAAALLEAPMVPKAQSKMAIDLEYCPKCQKVGLMDVVKWDGPSPDWIQNSTPVSGTGVAPFISLVKAHEKWRDEQEEEED